MIQTLVARGDASKRLVKGPPRGVRLSEDESAGPRNSAAFRSVVEDLRKRGEAKQGPGQRQGFLVSGGQSREPTAATDQGCHQPGVFWQHDQCWRVDGKMIRRGGDLSFQVSAIGLERRGGLDGLLIVIGDDSKTPRGDSLFAYWKVFDPQLTVIQVGNFASAAQGIATTGLRAVIGDLSLDDALTKREQINQVMRAEGDRQAAILRAEGFSLALDKIFSVAKTVDTNTMSLQYLEALKPLGAGPATKVVFPMEFTRLLQPFVDGVRGTLPQRTP
ncbi:MAG TPA: hypothetical protein VGX75_02705 [bacterium]|nr:hypothetical protein [bacterium]